MSGVDPAAFADPRQFTRVDIHSTHRGNPHLFSLFISRLRGQQEHPPAVADPRHLTRSHFERARQALAQPRHGGAEHAPDGTPLWDLLETTAVAHVRVESLLLPGSSPGSPRDHRGRPLPAPLRSPLVDQVILGNPAVQAVLREELAAYAARRGAAAGAGAAAGS